VPNYNYHASVEDDDLIAPDIESINVTGGKFAELDPTMSSLGGIGDKESEPLTWWQTLAVHYQYVTVGFFYGSMQPLMYPIFNHMLGMQSYAVKGGYQVMTIWWTLKMFIGAFSDAFPIMGYRRKPYILIGWTLAVAMTVVTITLGQPHKGDAAWPYLMCFSAINFFYIIADVAMDGMVTDLAQREKESDRGKLQSGIYFARFIAMAVTSALMAFGFSDERYGGTFSWSFDLPDYLLILVGIGLLGLYPYYRMEEEGGYQRQSYTGQFVKLFKRVQLNAVWRVVCFSFSVHFFAYISNAASYDIVKQWCNTEPWVNGLFSNVLSNLVIAGGIWITKKYLLNTSWHKILFWSIIGMSLLAYIPAIIVDLGVTRSQYFYAAAPLVSQLVMGIFFIVSSYCAVEVAEPGSEAIMYGLITTVGNLTVPFTTLISSMLATAFNLYDKDGNLHDDDAGRKRMLALDTVIFFLQLCALPTLLILPQQKAQIQALIATGARSYKMAVLVVVLLTFCMIWSLMGNFMQIFEGTACLKIVGGSGC